MTMPPRSHVGWSFGFAWALATFVGYIAGLTLGAIYLPIGWALIPLFNAGIDMSWLFDKFGTALSIGITTGFMIGLLQYLLLRKRIKHAGWWILAAAVGWVASVIITGGLKDIILVCALSGVISGTLQFIILWRQVNLALLWTLVNLAGWFIGGVYGLFIGPVIAGFITGFGMIWLLNNRDQRFMESDLSA